MKKSYLIGGLVVVLLVIFGYSSLKNEREIPTLPETSSTVPVLSLDGNVVNLSGQVAGASVMVDLVEFEEGGYVVIHEDKEGKPGKIIGVSEYLTKGSVSKLTVELDRNSQDGEVLYAMLHSDNGDRVYQAVDDLPIKDVRGGLVVAKSVIGEEEKQASSLTLSVGNFFFRPSSLTVNEGEVQVTVEQSSGGHTFVIDELNVKESLSVGSEFSFTAKPGVYEYYCDVPGHRQLGMVGSLQVN